MGRIAMLCGIVVASLGFTCAGPPVIANDLDRPITVTSTRNDGSVHAGDLPAAGRMYLSDSGHHPTQVTISIPGGESQTFTAENAPHLLSGPVRGAIVGWRVTDAGVVPLAESDLAE